MDKDLESFDPKKFKPMTEGLGLNHFADGLPYSSPQSRRKPPVQFNYPPPRAPRAPEPAPESVLAQQLDQESSRASFVLRSLAFAFDLFVATVLFAAIVWASFSLNGFNILELMSGRQSVQLFGPLALQYVVFYLAYFLIQETTWKRTLGKALFGIKIRAHSGFSILARALCFFIAAMPFGVGLFWYFFDSKRRCWHDVITDSEVVLSHG